MVVKSVRPGYFEDFKSSDTILMEADAEGLQRLATVFRSLASGKVHALVLHELPFIETYHGVQLIASCSGQDHGTRRGDATNAFLWERSNLGWEYSAEKLDVLIPYTDGHHYLEAADDEVIVQVSKGEYGDAWWLKHGGQHL